jgi:hypothetical protein
MTLAEWVRSLRERNAHLFQIDGPARTEGFWHSEIEKLAPLEKLNVADGIPRRAQYEEKAGDKWLNK